MRRDAFNMLVHPMPYPYSVHVTYTYIILYLTVLVAIRAASAVCTLQAPPRPPLPIAHARGHQLTAVLPNLSSLSTHHVPPARVPSPCITLADPPPARLPRTPFTSYGHSYPHSFTLHPGSHPGRLMITVSRACDRRALRICSTCQTRHLHPTHYPVRQ